LIEKANHRVGGSFGVFRDINFIIFIHRDSLEQVGLDFRKRDSYTLLQDAGNEICQESAAAGQTPSGD
jgi:hypothetical protein